MIGLDGGSGWEAAWRGNRAAEAHARLGAEGLDYEKGARLRTAGLALQLDGVSAGQNVAVLRPPKEGFAEGSFWVSCLMQQEAVGEESGGLLFRILDKADQNNRLFLSSDAERGLFAHLSSEAGPSQLFFATQLPEDAPLLLVMQVDRNAGEHGTVRAWINPEIGGGDPRDAVARANLRLNGAPGGIQSLGWIGGANSRHTVDELRLGRSFGEVTGFPEAKSSGANTQRPEDRRPAFDKSDHVGTAWVHVNDWKDVTYAQVPMETDRALYPTQGDRVSDAAVTGKLLEYAGLDGIYLQSVGFRTLGDYLEGFAKAGNNRKVALFIGRGGMNQYTETDLRSVDLDPDDEATVDLMVEAFTGFLEANRKWFLEHPNYHRVDGHPVFVLWALGDFPQDAGLWERALPRIEEQAYPGIWLLTDHFWKPDFIDEWLPVMDGAAQYAAGSHSHRMKASAEIIRSEWPQKIFDANAGPGHQSALQGGTGVDKGFGTRKLRDALENAIETLDGDAIHITNWNDYEENSHIFPSYMRRHSRLNMVRDYLMEWRGTPVERSAPELIVSNPSNLMVGEHLWLEVASLPVSLESPGSITIKAALSNAAGEIVHRFEAAEIDAASRKAVDFPVQTLGLAGNKSLHPVVEYTWHGKTRGPFHLRPTRLWVGLAPVDLPWSTPLDEWAGDLAVDWELRRPDLAEPVRPGETLIVDPGDDPLLHLTRTLNPAAKGIESETNLLLNGAFEQPFFMRNAAYAEPVNETLWEYRHTDEAPFAWLEIETETAKPRFIELADGGKRFLPEPKRVWNSRPIFVAKGGAWQEPVTVPVGVYEEDSEKLHEAWETSNYNMFLGVPIAEVVDVEVPKYRVPFFHYRFDRDRGNLAYDRSGYEHHAWLGTHGRNRFHESGPYGFRFSHHFANARFPLEKPGDVNRHAPEFRQDDAAGYLRFDGEHNYILFPPYTRLPQSGTYEMWIRHRPNGNEQTLLSAQPQWLIGQAGRRPMQFVLSLDAEGRPVLRTEVGGRREAERRLSESLPEDGWTHLALVHDLRHWHLYLNGEPVGEPLDSYPLGEYRGFTEMLFGLRPTGKGNAWNHNNPNQVADPFAGDLHELRFSARPLAPEEFLPHP